MPPSYRSHEHPTSQAGTSKENMIGGLMVIGWSYVLAGLRGVSKRSHTGTKTTEMRRAFQLATSDSYSHIHWSTVALPRANQTAGNPAAGVCVGRLRSTEYSFIKDKRQTDAVKDAYAEGTEGRDIVWSVNAYLCGMESSGYTGSTVRLAGTVIISKFGRPRHDQAELITTRLPATSL
ncbi:hypothetical protein BKA93DRAFT_750697 [Sparassis latifolia]